MRQALTGVLAFFLIGSILPCARATETENIGIRILPTPGKVTVDGKFDDWDLTGGVFVCSDAENLREKIGCWVHFMWDKDNLYVLSRWIDDTPLNNPGQVGADQAFAGDCLQVRTICYMDHPDTGNPEPKDQRTGHWNCWRDRNKRDIIEIAYGVHFDQGMLKDAKQEGAQQAFLVNPDGKGYVQEISVPWKLISPDGWSPRAGGKILTTVEPNFGTESKFRISMKDIFRGGVVLDRVFTFGGPQNWGFGTLEEKGSIRPRPLRLADGREFNVSMQNGIPVVDWNGLYVEKKLEGFANIHFTMPEDGYVSLNIKDSEGKVVRQLLTANFFSKGDHDVKWDGLTTMSHRKPGDPITPGQYTWEAIWHKGLGLRLVGWADNAGRAPFDSPGGNWGGDMSSPASVTTTKDSIILGWYASEAGRAVVCIDFDGNVKWRHKRGGFGGAAFVAADADVVYVYDYGQGNTLYRLNATSGEFSAWEGSIESTLEVGKLIPEAPSGILSGMDAHDGKIFLAFGGDKAANRVAVLDAKTGKLLSSFAVPNPGDIEIGPDGKLYVVSNKNSVVRCDVGSGNNEPVISGLKSIGGIALDSAGNIYVSSIDPDDQIKVYDAKGQQIREIGAKGGRPKAGKWNQNTVSNVMGLRVDAKGMLWAAEANDHPRRFSEWNAADGKFVKEFFGPSSYGAGGGAINPADPLYMFGQGCEWKINPDTGKSDCVAIVDTDEIGNARFAFGPHDEVYLAVGGGWAPHFATRIYQRLAAGEWKLRTKLMPMDKDGKPVFSIESNAGTGIAVWADENDDQQEQPNEVHAYKMDFVNNAWISGWYMPMTQKLINYGTTYRLAPTGFTACAAPIYDPSSAKKMPVPQDLARGGMGAQLGCGSEDGKLMVYNGGYGLVHSDFQCFDIDSGKLKWTYPSNFTGVHGGHLAPPPEVGLIRAAYDIVGSVKLPDPVGDVFVIATDKGEWHLLNGEGYYLSALFQADPMKIQWPDPAIPGAIMDNVPPGMGAEDFGGSVSATKDGQLYIQAGKTAFINMKVVGLESVKKLGNGTVAVSDADITLAQGFREKLQQKAGGMKSMQVVKASVNFTGDIAKDFGGNSVQWTKNNSNVTAALAHDDANLYLAWSVDDQTPFLNGATESVSMYAKGDTVDFQLAVDAAADPARSEAVLGDMRLSIGNFQNKPTAVLYKPISTDKHPHTFYSGTVKQGWEVQSIETLDDAKITVTKDPSGKSYVVEAVVPMARLGLQLKDGQKLRGDFGVTYGGSVGDKTIMRSYWSNQATDFVADEVWELKLEPRNWGQLEFTN